MKINKQLKEKRKCSHCGGPQKRIESFDMEWVCEKERCGHSYIISFSQAFQQQREEIVEKLEKNREKFIDLVEFDGPPACAAAHIVLDQVIKTINE